MSEALALLKSAWAVWCQTWRYWAIAWALTLPFLWWLSQWDALWLSQLQLEPTHNLHQWARGISEWGDFFRFNVIVLLVGWPIAHFCRASRARRTLLVVFLAAGLAGIAVQLGRAGLGRPRPSAELPDGFYGPSLDSRFHGFPSGHTTTAFATATSLCVLHPMSAPVALPLAASVGWSRMQLDRHHPTDLLAGALLGTLFGTTMAAASKRLGRQQSSATRPDP
jgi:membrane-associated phospholipid phosphatase